MLKNFQVAQDVTILHHFPYKKGSLINLELMIHYIIPSTTSPAMKSPCFKVKSISYEMKINGKNETEMTK